MLALPALPFPYANRETALRRPVPRDFDKREEPSTHECEINRLPEFWNNKGRKQRSERARYTLNPLNARTVKNPVPNRLPHSSDYTRRDLRGLRQCFAPTLRIDFSRRKRSGVIRNRRVREDCLWEECESVVVRHLQDRLRGYVDRSVHSNASGRTQS